MWAFPSLPRIRILLQNNNLTSITIMFDIHISCRGISHWRCWSPRRWGWSWSYDHVSNRMKIDFFRIHVGRSCLFFFFLSFKLNFCVSCVVWKFEVASCTIHRNYDSNYFLINFLDVLRNECMFSSMHEGDWKYSICCSMCADYLILGTFASCEMKFVSEFLHSRQAHMRRIWVDLYFLQARDLTVF